MGMIFVNRDRRSLGQFTEQDVANGLQSGQLLPGDLGWQEGMESWQALSLFTNLPPPVPGATAVGTPPPLETKAIPFEQPGEIRYGECLSKAWECFRETWGLCVVATLIFFAISMVVQAPMQIAQSVMEGLRHRGGSPGEQLPLIIGLGVVFLFFYLVATGVSSILSAGVMYFFIETLRNGKAKLENLFVGFRHPVWIQLLLAMFVWILVVMVIALVLIIPGIILTTAMKSAVPVIVASVLVLIPIIYLSVGIGFVFPLIVDRKLGFKEALVTCVKTVHRQWFQTFGLLILVALLAVAGMLACCVGMLATLPFGYLVWAQGYRQLFGDRDPSQN